MKARTEATLDEARAAFARVTEAATKARADLAQREAALAAMEAESGQAMFTARLDANADEEARIMAALDAGRRDVETSRRIADASQGAIAAAQRGVWVAEAHDLRAKVAELWPDVRARLVEAAELLEALFAAEGCRWLPEPWAVEVTGAVRPFSWKRTKTGELIAEILSLEADAERKERRAGLESPPSVLAGRPDVALHLGHGGMVTTTAPAAPPSGWDALQRAWPTREEHHVRSLRG